MSSEGLDSVRQEGRRISREHPAGRVGKIEWNESFSVGIPEMDAEQRRFIGLVNDFNAALVERGQERRIREVLCEMPARANLQFQNEQQLFERYGYPDTRRHSELHLDIIGALTEVIEEFRKDETSAAWVECGLLFTRTLATHLLEEDRRYRDWLGSSYRSMREMTMGRAGSRQTGS